MPEPHDWRRTAREATVGEAAAGSDRREIAALIRITIMRQGQPFYNEAGTTVLEFATRSNFDV